MAAAMTPVEFLIVEAAARHRGRPAAARSRGAGGGPIYVGLLALLAPATGRELLRGARTARGSLLGALRGTPDEDALDEAEAPLPGSTAA